MDEKTTADKKQPTTMELVDKSQTEIPLILTSKRDDIESLVEQADKQLAFFQRIKLISLKYTNPDDWLSQDDKPYLQHMGTFKIRQLWNVEILDQRIEKEEMNDDAGRFLLFTCYGKARFMNKEIEDIGTCSTRDDFFGHAHGSLKDIEEVDIESCKKKSATNFQNRILKKILGLSFTWKDLESAGIDISKIRKVGYNKTISEEDKLKQDELKTILKEVYANDAKAIKEWLGKATTFLGKDGKQVPGVDAVERLAGTRLNICLGKAHSALETFKKTATTGSGKPNGGGANNGGK